MLPRYNRLAKKKEIDLVFKKGRSSYNKSLGVKCLINNNLTYNRFAVVVSNKVSKKAVIRNKIKRRIREIIKKELIKMVVGRDLIIITLPVIAEKNFTEIQQELCGIFARLSLYKNEK